MDQEVNMRTWLYMHMNNQGAELTKPIWTKVYWQLYVCLSHFAGYHWCIIHSKFMYFLANNFGHSFWLSKFWVLQCICFLQDFGVHGIAPRAVATKEEFSQSTQQGTKRAVSGVLHTVIPGASALKNLVVPAHSTIGAKLLKALGWREGEGLGPKVMKYGSQQGGLSVQCNNYYCLSGF